MAISARDRDYMRRLGVFEAQARSDTLRAHRALPLAERLRVSVALSRRFWGSANHAARVDDPAPLYERARRLGLYRP